MTHSHTANRIICHLPYTTRMRMCRKCFCCVSACLRKRVGSNFKAESCYYEQMLFSTKKQIYKNYKNNGTKINAAPVEILTHSMSSYHGYKSNRNQKQSILSKNNHFRDFINKNKERRNNFSFKTNKNIFKRSCLVHVRLFSVIQSMVRVYFTKIDKKPNIEK